jgi:hypothetical protein
MVPTQLLTGPFLLLFRRYVIEKAKARLNEVAVRSNVHDWGAVFKL